jgi:programmed cell death protein 5
VILLDLPADDSEIEEIKRRKLAELQRRQMELARIQEERERELLEARRQQILRSALTPEARARLEAVKMIKPELVTAVEDQIIQLALSGRINSPLTEEQIKALLRAFQSERETRIIRR